MVNPQPPIPIEPRAWVVALLSALPFLLAYTESPSATALNQLLSFATWGMALVGLAQWRWGWERCVESVWALVAPLLALCVLEAEVVISTWNGLPNSLGALALLSLLSAGLVMWAAQQGGGSPDSQRSDEPVSDLDAAMLAGLLLAGVVSSLIALIQVYAPEWADGAFIARSGLVGRAVGNLRQPNHLSTLLLWALIALVPLAQAGRVLGWRLDERVAMGLAALLTLGVVLTASRTGVLGVLFLGAWGALDRRLARRLRWTLGAVPALYLLYWLAMAGWGHLTHQTYIGEARLSDGDLSSSRFGIWANAWSLVMAHPWAGVGWGEFNFAWTLTPFPGRPVAFFDHTHNLPLQLAVELGLPVALLVVGLLLWALVQAFQRTWHQDGASGATGRAALMLVLLVGLHGLLEYPLWYAYFLLPTAWALGRALRMPSPPELKASAVQPSEPTVPGGQPWFAWMGGVMVVGALLAWVDYERVVVIYQPGHDTRSLDERIVQGQRSPLYGHLADYAAATVSEPPSLAMPAFAGTTHSLLDTRLMMAWARALAESGQTDKARYLAERLTEFRNPASAGFFAACQAGAEPAASASASAFQCEAPRVPLGWRDFLP